MIADDLTPETRAALVAIIQRAARRGRELREQKETADLGELGQTQASGGNPAPMGQSANRSIRNDR